MKNMKKILALLIAALLVLTSMSVAFAVDAGTYTIEVTNSNPNVSINDKTYKAYKLFDVTYVTPYTAGGNTIHTTPYGNDQTPHAYTLSTSSTFYTTAAAKTEIQKYFTLTTIEGDTSKVIVMPIEKDANGKVASEDGFDKTTAKSIFTAEAAYALTEALIPYLPGTENASGTGANEKVTIDVSNHGDAGYYLVTGEGYAKDADGTVNTSKTVTAAVALTTTDPKAKIVAKVDAPTIDKKIDEHGKNGNPGTYSESGNKTYDVSGTQIIDLTEDNHAIGDTVPYVVKTKMPNMTGYEKYYFIVNDTMSKGLTFKNDVAIKFVDKNGNVLKTLANTDFTVTTTGGNGADTKIEIVFKNFVQYKGTLVTAENLQTVTGSDNSALIGTYWGSYEDCDIIITYSATLNEYAVIGDLGNPNTLYLTYSNNPDKKDKGEPDNPDKPENPDVTGETPESTTKTYVTGLKVLKYTTTDGTTKNPLADAKFEFTGTNLNVLKETDTKYFRAAGEGETATHYLLKDGTYTTTDPVTQDDSATTEIDERTIDSYVKTWTGDTPAPGYLIDNVKTWSKEGTKPGVKITATTDSEGLLTFTGLACGEYVLEETEAPAGYNKLDKKLYITVSAGETEEGNLATHTFTVTYKLGTDGEVHTLASSEQAANLFELEVENKTGVELPSTGGMGTTILYIGGSILVILAAVLLITKRRMNAED